MQNSSYYSFERNEIFPFIPQDIQRTLDVGCASGIFSTKLKQARGVETWGIEMQKDIAEIAKSKLDRVLVGSFEEVCDQLPQHYFDCIFLNDVLEHMPDPESCLRRIKSNMLPKGTIIASIPNMRYIEVLIELLFRKDWRYRDSGILDRTHLRFFTKKSMIRMFQDCGYKIDMVKGINGVSPFCLTSILSKLSLNSLEDLKYKQYIILASSK